MSSQLDFIIALRQFSGELMGIYLAHPDLHFSRKEHDLFYEILNKMEDLGARINSHVVHSDKYLLVRANGEVSEVRIPKDRFRVLVQNLIDCDTFEFVPVCNGYIFVVDDCGNIFDDPKPINNYCSSYCAGTIRGDPIVGDVLIGKYDYVGFESDIVGLDAAELRKWKLNVKNN